MAHIVNRLPRNESQDKERFVQRKTKATENVRLSRESFGVEVSQLMVSWIFNMASGHGPRVTFWRADCMGERIGEQVRVPGMLGIVEHYGGDSENATGESDARPHDSRHDIRTNASCHTHQTNRSRGQFPRETRLVSCLPGENDVFHSVAFEKVRSHLLYPRCHGHLVTPSLHLLMEGTEEVDVRGMENVDQDAHLPQHAGGGGTMGRMHKNCEERQATESQRNNVLFLIAVDIAVSPSTRRREVVIVKRNPSISSMKGTH